MKIKLKKPPLTSLLMMTLLPNLSHANWFSDLALGDFGVGIGIDLTQYEYRGKKKSDINLKANGSLFLEYHGERFIVNRSGLSYALFKTEDYRFDVLAESIARGYEEDDNNIFKGMDERNRSVDAGFRFSAKIPYSQVSLTATTDISGQHKGQEVALNVGGFALDEQYWSGSRQFAIAPVAGIRWQSQKVVDYYYGVQDKEANSQRKAYQTKSATSGFIGLEGQVLFSKHFTLRSGLRYHYLPKSIDNSPLTRDKHQNYVFNVEASYWF